MKKTEENKDAKGIYWTLESPNGNTKNQTDYILSSQRGTYHQNCEVITKVTTEWLAWLEPKFS